MKYNDSKERIMEAVTYTELRKNMKSVMDNIVDNHEPVLIHRQNGSNLILMSSDDYEGIKETLYLLQTPANAGRLYKGLDSFNASNGHEKELIEE